MKLRFVSIVAIVLGVFIFGGCGGSKPAPQKKTQAEKPKFEIGKTTKEDVIAALGEPSGDSFNSVGEEVLFYRHTRVTGKAWIPFYYGHDRVRTKFEQYKFKDGILTGIAQSHQHY